MYDEGLFKSQFEALTGNSPFPWQEALFAKFVESQFPRASDIPTGLGKTSVLAIWLLALAHHARSTMLIRFPRRLAYVVNRRTVVDQATREAEQMRRTLRTRRELQVVVDALQSLAARPSDTPLAISTLRGQFADNAEWRTDPARPAIIVGTVDMIGSRLLFAGYGRGFKSRPLHAGFLGQDTLLVHDEAHLEPAFQELVTAIESEQQRRGEFRQFRAMALTATSRNGDEPFGLTKADRKHEEVKKRITAKKGITFYPVGGEKEIVEAVTKQALAYKASGLGILIFLRTVDSVQKVADRLRREKSVQTLTGTMRGLERDALAKEDKVFARFMPKPEPDVVPEPGTVYLVCTSAGEVGVNISADHLVCDLVPFDSMVQRFGRVNRFGRGNAHIDVVHGSRQEASERDDRQAEGEADRSSGAEDDVRSKKKVNGSTPFDKACGRTLELLRQLPLREDERHDASPAALANLLAADRRDAFTPPPTILHATDILFDTWALTSIRQKLPGRPPVANWLHGVAEWEPPETYVAWRDEVECIAGELLERYMPEDLEDLLDDFPLKPHELLRDRTRRVFEQLETMAARRPDLSAWLVDSDGGVRVLSLSALVEKDSQKRPLVNLADSTVILPPAIGGLEKGILSGTAAFDDSGCTLYDIADKWLDEENNPRRCRIWDDEVPPSGMRRVRTIDTRLDVENETGADESSPARRYWCWYVRPRWADDDGSRSAREPQELMPHLKLAERFSSMLAAKLLSEPEASAVTLAAKWHDLGKRRELWQRSIGNRDHNLVLAKPGIAMRPVEITGYRHEFGSLLDVSNEPAFCQLAPDTQDLVLHLIAAHHGRGRPHFPRGEAFDPECPDTDVDALAREVPRRFARLQRKYGRWGLAYLESLVRAADAAASQPSEASETRLMEPNARSTSETN